METRRCYPIHWVKVRFRFRSGRKLLLAYAGFCGKTGHLFKLATASLTVMVVRDFRADDKLCEEGEGCLYRGCPLNRTTARSLEQRTGIKLGGKEPNWTLGDRTLAQYDLPNEAEGYIVAESHGGPLIEFNSVQPTVQPT
jgi:hypothetical protein